MLNNGIRALKVFSRVILGRNFMTPAYFQPIFVEDLGSGKALTVVMVDKKPEHTDMVLELFGKREGFTHKASTKLAKSVIETFNMVGQASLFADRTMAFGGEDFGVRLPEIGVKDGALSIGRPGVPLR